MPINIYRKKCVYFTFFFHSPPNRRAERMRPPRLEELRTLTSNLRNYSNDPLDGALSRLTSSSSHHSALGWLSPCARGQVFKTHFSMHISGYEFQCGMCQLGSFGWLRQKVKCIKTFLIFSDDLCIILRKSHQVWRYELIIG